MLTNRWDKLLAIFTSYLLWLKLLISISSKILQSISILVFYLNASTNPRRRCRFVLGFTPLFFLLDWSYLIESVQRLRLSFWRSRGYGFHGFWPNSLKVLAHSVIALARRARLSKHIIDVERWISNLAYLQSTICSSQRRLAGHADDATSLAMKKGFLFWILENFTAQMIIIRSHIAVAHCTLKARSVSDTIRINLDKNLDKEKISISFLLLRLAFAYRIRICLSILWHGSNLANYCMYL